VSVNRAGTGCDGAGRKGNFQKEKEKKRKKKKKRKPPALRRENALPYFFAKNNGVGSFTTLFFAKNPTGD
jgi:hypothetical protein